MLLAEVKNANACLVVSFGDGDPLQSGKSVSSVPFGMYPTSLPRSVSKSIVRPLRHPGPNVSFRRKLLHEYAVCKAATNTAKRTGCLIFAPLPCPRYASIQYSHPCEICCEDPMLASSAGNYECIGPHRTEPNLDEKVCSPNDLLANPQPAHTPGIRLYSQLRHPDFFQPPSPPPKTSDRSASQSWGSAWRGAPKGPAPLPLRCSAAAIPAAGAGNAAAGFSMAAMGWKVGWADTWRACCGCTLAPKLAEPCAGYMSSERSGSCPYAHTL